MKTIVVYCSLTGNTEKIALAISRGIKKVTGQCDIINIKDANPKRLREYDLIGFGSFVLGAEPKNVSDFLANVSCVGGKHVFAFSTHGCSPSSFFPSIFPKFVRKGLIVIGLRDWFGDVNIYHCPKPYPTDGHPDEQDLKEAEDYGAEMVDRSKKISAGNHDLIIRNPPTEENPAEGGPTYLPPLTLKFQKERCVYPKCRLCMDNCPVDGLDLTVDPPVLSDCIGCEHCLRLCPTGALDADEFMRYSVPGTPMGKVVKENFLPWLDKEEAAGRFRRHVAIKDIGWDTPLSKRMYGKHPHWIIGKGFVQTDK